MAGLSLFCIFLSIWAFADSKVIECKTTQRDLNIHDCTIETVPSDNSKQCLSVDVKGEVSGYFLLWEGVPTLCVNWMYKYENKSDPNIQKGIYLFRGANPSSAVKNCREVCQIVREAQRRWGPAYSTIYISCSTNENGNDEDLTSVVNGMSSSYTCSNDDNYKTDDRAMVKQPSQVPDWVNPIFIVQIAVLVLAALFSLLGIVLTIAVAKKSKKISSHEPANSENF